MHPGSVGAAPGRLEPPNVTAGECYEILDGIAGGYAGLDERIRPVEQLVAMVHAGIIGIWPDSWSCSPYLEPAIRTGRQVSP